jgi:hypothetical protein
MGKQKLQLAILSVLLLAFGFLWQVPSASSELSDVTIRVLQSDKTPQSGVLVSAQGIAQPSKRTNTSGETVWKVQPGSQSFQIQFPIEDDPWVPTISFTVNLVIQGLSGEIQTIELPERVKAIIPVSDATKIGTSFYATWEYNSATQILVNGLPRTVYVSDMPSVVRMFDGVDGKAIEVGYSKKIKLSGPNSSDVDGDLIPDIKMSIATQFGKVSHTIMSSLGAKPQSPISLAQVPWVDVKVKNEEMYLSVMLQGKDITDELAGGTFFARTPDSLGPNATIKGRTALYPWGNKSFELNNHFYFSINNTVLAISDEIRVQTRKAICSNNEKGWTGAFQTLGACPPGWTLTATLKKLSEKKYSSCSALNKVLVGGVAKPNALNLGKRAFKGWLTHNPGYLANRHLDSDRDGIACER